MRSHLYTGKLRGSTDYVLTVTLPKIIFHDSMNMPDKLCLAPENYSPHMLKKALRYLENDTSQRTIVLHENNYYVLR